MDTIQLFIYDFGVLMKTQYSLKWHSPYELFGLAAFRIAVCCGELLFFLLGFFDDMNSATYDN